MSVTNTNKNQTPERSLKWQGKNQAVEAMITALMEKHGKRIQDQMESNPSLSLNQVVLTVALHATMTSEKHGKQQEVVLTTQASHTGKQGLSTERTR
jgi:hypothetical protein